MAIKASHLFSCVLLAGCLSGSATKDPHALTNTASDEQPALSAARAIRAESLSARVRFLADDALEGRATGERGYDVAARYVASEMQAIGLAPAGKHGSYFQRVPLRGIKPAADRSRITLASTGGRDEVLAQEDGVLLFSDGDAAMVEVTAPLVFAGYGVSAPEYKYDDTDGVDLGGKIAVVLFGAPKTEGATFPSAARAHYSDSENKRVALKKKGAVGVLIVATPELDQMAPWPFLVNQARFEQMVTLEGGHPASTVLGVPVRGRVSRAGFERVLARAGRAGQIEQIYGAARDRSLRPFDLGITAHVEVASQLRDIASENVIGLLPGKARASEYVVYSAHLDHLGIGAPVDGDSVYNGANDNASGVAGILSVAEAFGALKSPPDRSIVFVAVTGEEKGLLGSDYFAAHPTVPFQGIVANINIDGMTPLWDPYDIEPLGAEHSSLMTAVRAAGAASGLRVTPDSHPDAVYFVRSDQYSFIKRGIPSLFPFPGTQDATGPSPSNAAIQDHWMKTKYHRPSDEWDKTYDWNRAVKLARFDFFVGLSVANATERPSWNANDFFERFRK